METKRITRMGLLVALSLILSYIESQIPSFFMVPGIKLGLSNVCIVFALYTLFYKDAFFISILRVFISSLLFGSVLSLLYSLSGAIVSFFIMALMKKTGIFSSLIVSIVGGVMHNTAQLLVAILVIGTSALLYYIPFLLISGVVTGAVIGYLASIVLKRMEEDNSIVVL